MPTPPLPLLHQLLRILHIPVYPPTLSSISPSLLLIILESLLGHPIPLAGDTRLCANRESELSVVKCILGVLADDYNLGMGMMLVDPTRVVEGGERELEVLIMAFAVVAKRKGLDLRIPSERVEDLWDAAEDEEGDEVDGRWGEGGLQDPIEPDISFTSPTTSYKPPPSMSPFRSTSTSGSRRQTMTTTTTKTDELEDVFTAPNRNSTSSSESTKVGNDDPEIEIKAHQPADTDFNSSDLGSTSTSTVQRSRTVLEEILEEFGM